MSMPNKLRMQLQDLALDDLASTSSILDLPDDVLARIMSYLDPAGLSSVEWSCQRFRSLVIEHESWKVLCMAACPQLARLHADVCVEGLLSREGRNGGKRRGGKGEAPNRAVLRSAAFYRLHAELSAPDTPHSLLAHTLAASSTDNPEEHASNVLTPISTFRPALGARSGSYWSSKGSEDQGSAEWLLFQLAHPLCLIRSIAIRPFRAFFQRGNPIYSAQAVRFVFSCAQPLCDGCRDGDSAYPDPAMQQQQAPQQWQQQQGLPVLGPAELQQLLQQQAAMDAAVSLAHTPSRSSPGGSSSGEGASGGDAEDGFAREGTAGLFRPYEVATPLLPMARADELQVFELPQPLLCVGGRLKVELVGRVQRQEQDAAWYTCINHVRVLGKPLHNFVPALPIPGSATAPAAQPCPNSGSGGGCLAGQLLLRMVRTDPMVAAGGLMKLSEGGTLEERLSLEAQHAELLGEGPLEDAGSDDEGGLADMLPVGGHGGMAFFAPVFHPQAFEDDNVID